VRARCVSSARRDLCGGRQSPSLPRPPPSARECHRCGCLHEQGRRRSRGPQRVSAFEEALQKSGWKLGANVDRLSLGRGGNPAVISFTAFDARDLLGTEALFAWLQGQSDVPRVVPNCPTGGYQQVRQAAVDPIGDITMPSTSRNEVLKPIAHGRANRLFGLFIKACVLVLTCFGATAPSFARTSFDGDWSVVIVTRGGACAPTLRYPVAINNGIVRNAGDTSAAVRGRVAPTGAVRVTVQSGGSWASGSGHLSATRGSGIWRGQGTSGICEGTWQAERRTYGAQVIERGAPSYNYAPPQWGQYYPRR